MEDALVDHIVAALGGRPMTHEAREAVDQPLPVDVEVSAACRSLRLRGGSGPGGACPPRLGLHRAAQWHPWSHGTP